MTVSRIAVGAGTVGTSSPVTIPLPVEVAAGDLVLLPVGFKRSTRNLVDTNGYTTTERITAGTGSSGVSDSGALASVSQYKTAVVSEANPVLIWDAAGGPIPVICAALLYRKTTGDWDVFTTSGGQSASGTQMVVAGASNLNLVPGDKVVVHSTHVSNAGPFANPVITVAGCTLSAVTTLLQQGTESGDDLAYGLYEVTVTAGSSTGAPGFQLDAGDGTNRSAQGTAQFHRIRTTGEFETFPSDGTGYVKVAGNYRLLDKPRVRVAGTYV